MLEGRLTHEIALDGHREVVAEKGFPLSALCSAPSRDNDEQCLVRAYARRRRVADEGGGLRGSWEELEYQHIP
ncbi:hypothetical protein HZH68_016903 [Vespula germanica]|uniref:Uncharacterized protein n=1 Tax=Vespula germanica TaxID=30212 RepID=A0A834MPB2_VESGE|nr:hypothetical protein HZH68_016903 [Vespula germanica]